MSNYTESEKEKGTLQEKDHCRNIRKVERCKCTNYQKLHGAKNAMHLSTTEKYILYKVVFASRDDTIFLYLQLSKEKSFCRTNLPWQE